MLILEKEEFDLNFLFSFDSLKRILLKLAKSQNKLENEMKSMQQNISKRDKIIFNIRKKVFNNENIEEINDDNFKGFENDENLYNEEENKGYNNLNFEKKEFTINKELKEVENIKNQNLKDNDEILTQKNNDIKYYKTEAKDDKDENMNDSFNKINNLKDSQNMNISINQNGINVNLGKENYESKIPFQKEDSNKNINLNQQYDNSDNQKTPYKDKIIDEIKDQSPSNAFYVKEFTKISNQLRELKERINSFDKKLSSKDDHVKNLENNIKNNILDHDMKNKNINEKIDLLFKNNQTFSEKIEKLEVKTSDMDILSMFKDNGDGNIDLTKVLVKSLEEKVFKKFELIDEKYKKDFADNLKLKTDVENIIPKLDQINREIERLNELNKQNNDEFNSYKKENEQKINENISDINEEIIKKINEVENNIKNKISTMEKNLNDLMNKSKENNDLDFLKLSLGNSKDAEKFDKITKRINDLRTKMNDIENTLKLHINSKDIDSIKNEMKDMKLILDKKITKEDLKELYNFHLNDKDEINDLKERESIMHDELDKATKDLQNLQQRVESINGNLSLLQNNPKNENLKIIDFSKYIDNKKFSDTLKPIIKELEKIISEIESLKREVTESTNKNSTTIKSAINLIEDDTNNKMSDFKKAIQKKYLEKFEFHKTIKALEIQIKSNTEDKKKLESDNWLLAKKPLNCFTCASCEAKIKNEEYTPADYLAWKKYPRGEKIHRMGQGFSHMLQMMTSEFIKNIEKNEYPNDNESSSRNINNPNLSTSPSFPINERSNLNSVYINNKERDDSIGLKKKNKILLPKMTSNSKNKIKLINGDNLNVSDDENNDAIISEYRSKETEINKDINSPKILKITKKGKPNITEIGKNKGIFKNLVTSQGIFTPREKNNQFE